MAKLKLVEPEPIPVKNDGNFIISTGGSRFTKTWKNAEWSWGRLLARLSDSLRTKETHAQFVKMSGTEQDNIKDVGGFVGGYLKDGIRRGPQVEYRQLITLDADHMPEGTDLADLMIDAFDSSVGFAVYVTHKHTPEKPRQRLVIPLTRKVSAEEYEAIARKIAEKLGIELFDDSTYQPERLMYWPSHPKDVEPYFYPYDAPWLDPDAILALYPDWTDTSFWPVSSRVNVIRKKEMEKAGDPLEKPGIIGAFNRAYLVPDAMEKFLPGVYTPTTKEDRFTYAEGTTAAGLVIYNDGLFAYSNHSTDPASRQLCNAFDLVRIHKFGHLDDDKELEKPINKRASFKEMQAFASKDTEVGRLLAREQAEKAVADFKPLEDDEELVDKLDRNKNGDIKPTLVNSLIILTYAEELASIRRNLMTGTLEADVDMPWNREFEDWRNLDTDLLYSHVAKVYGVQFPKELFRVAMETVANERAFHPVKDYLSSLPEWDGTPRADELLVKYLDAEDNVYTREAMLKILMAAVARIFDPGVKFDNMLVVVGEQGIGKSMLIRRLFRGYVCDSLVMTDMRDSKTGGEKIQGSWGVEVQEMAGMRKADTESSKAFISLQYDIYRPAYGRDVERKPRRCVFFGTTNSMTGFLRDNTGNRRFWPITCRREPKDKQNKGLSWAWDLTEEDVAQIWAEVKHRYEAGESFLLSDEAEELAAGAQRDALEEDPRKAQVELYLERKLPKNWDKMDLDTRRMYLDGDESHPDEDLVERETVSNMEIWVECLGKNRSELNRSEMNALVTLMERVDGWKRVNGQRRVPLYGKQRIYEKWNDNLVDF